MHVVCAVFPYDSDNMVVVRVLCTNDGDNMHDVRALKEDLTHPCIVTVEPFGSRKYTGRPIILWEGE